MFRLLFLIVFAPLFVQCTNTDVTKKHAKNHIFFVVDGMGASHITGARLYKGGPEANLAMDQMPYTGFVKTHSSSDYTTDSAAAATTYATGLKTYNRSIGMSDPKKDPSGASIPLTTIFDSAQKAGKSVGLISTARITHATPAAYYAHVKDRSMEDQIAEQLVDANIDLIIGGGRRFFVSQSEGGSRQDEKNLLNQFQEKKYEIAKTEAEFKNLNLKTDKKILALLEDDHLAYDLDRTDDQASLTDYVDVAIKYLSQNPKGYILVIEAGRVDHASHANIARHTFGDMLAFDKALARSLEENTKNTLVVATSDHETGGLSLNGYAPYETATGEKLLGNHKRKADAPLSDHGLVGWASGPGFNSALKVDENNKNFQHKATYPAPVAYHTAVDVPIMASGPGADQFIGFMDNTEIAKKVVKIMKLESLNQDDISK